MQYDTPEEGIALISTERYWLSFCNWGIVIIPRRLMQVKVYLN